MLKELCAGTPGRSDTIGDRIAPQGYQTDSFRDKYFLESGAVRGQRYG
jgi:hypothetical protein